MKLADVAPGSLVFTREYLGDDRNNMELREVFYLKQSGYECKSLRPYECCCQRLAIVQGEEGSPNPRYYRLSKHRVPLPTDARIEVHSVARSGGSRFFRREIIDGYQQDSTRA